MRISRLAVLASATMAIALAACGHHDQPQVQATQAVPQAQVVQAPPQQQVIEQPAPQVVQAAPAPVYVQQQPQVVVAQPAPVVVHDNSAANLMAGMAIGSMMSGGGRDVHHYHYAPAPVHQTTVIQRTYVRPAPAYTPSYSRPSVTHSVTTTTTYRRR